MGGSGRLGRVASAAVVVVLAVAGGQMVAASARADATPTTIAVDRTRPFGELPADFVGLSYEMRELATLCTTGVCPGNFDARQGNLVALYRNLGRGNVRIAGNHRPAPYGFAEHKVDWEACAAVVGSTRIAAPDLSQPTGTADWFSQFAQAEHSKINMLTAHNYTGATTITQLLSPQIHTKEV